MNRIKLLMCATMVVISIMLAIIELLAFFVERDTNHIIGLLLFAVFAVIGTSIGERVIDRKPVPENDWNLYYIAHGTPPHVMRGGLTEREAKQRERAYNEVHIQSGGKPSVKYVAAHKNDATYRTYKGQNQLLTTEE